MSLLFPSPEFDDAVAAVCHGAATEEQAQALNGLLRNDARARDEYILRVELHSQLASEPDLFLSAAVADAAARESEPRAWRRTLAFLSPGRARGRRLFWGVALAGNLVLAATVAWRIGIQPANPGAVAISKAVAMLSETANARWAISGNSPRWGAPLEPGWLKLEAGLAQVVFYSGARVVMEGPAELKIVSANRAMCLRGKVTAEVPAQARGFQIDTPQGKITDLGTAFGLEVNDSRTEVHVFKGEVTLQAAAHTDESLHEGSGAVMETSNALHLIQANPGAFASLFGLQAKSAAADARRLDQWRTSGEHLNRDPSLVIRFDFRDAKLSRWQLPNIAEQSRGAGDATIVGCQWGEGRWPGKSGIEFQNVSDRVRLNVPGQSDALTAAAWVRVQGLDRKLNSLFMCDGFAAGSVHWLVRNDGALGITIVGEGAGNYQIAASRPILTVDKFGMWIHLAVVVDGRAGRVIHYVNGQPVGETSLRIKPPFRIGTAELGNWNAKGFPKNDPFMIRNFSGAMDEFCLFLRALDAREINSLYSEGRPDAEVTASRE